MTSPIYTPHERMFFNSKLEEDIRFDYPTVLKPFWPSPETQGDSFFNTTGLHEVDPEEYPEPPIDHPSYHDAPWYHDYGETNFCDAMWWSGPRKQVFVVCPLVENGVSRNDLLVCDENFSDYSVVKTNITSHLLPTNRAWRVMFICAAPVVENIATLAFMAETTDNTGSTRITRGWWTDWNGNVLGTGSNLEFISVTGISGTRYYQMYACMGDHSIASADDSVNGRTGMFVVGREERPERKLYFVSHQGTGGDATERIFAVPLLTNASTTLGIGSLADPTRGPIYFHPSFDFTTSSLLVPMMDYVGTNQWQCWVRRFTRISLNAGWREDNVSHIDLAVTDVPAVEMDPDLEFFLPMFRPHIAWISEPDDRLYIHYLSYATQFLTDEERDEHIGLFAYTVDGLEREKVSDRVTSEEYTRNSHEPHMALGPGTRGRWEI